MRVNAPRFLIALAATMIVAAGCGSSHSDSATDVDPAPSLEVSTTTLPPDPWAEFEANFLSSCVAADDGAVADEGALNDYCRCAYGETVEFYGTAEAFAFAERSGEPDPLLERAWEGCAALHLS